MSNHIDLAALVARIESEYREMPGLLLTELQMQRPWGLDRSTCDRVVSVLVSRHVLVKTRRDAYARAEHQGSR